MGLDRNSNDFHRLMRNSQRARHGDGTAEIKVASPITNTSGKLGLNIASAGGLQNNSGVGIKLNTNSGLQLAAGGVSLQLDTNPALVLGTGGLKVLLATSNPGLTTTGGLAVTFSGTTITSDAAGLKIKFTANSGLGDFGGLGFNFADTSLATSASGVFVNLNALTPGLTVSSGLKVKLADATMGVSSSGIFVALASNQGLATTVGGLQVVGVQTGTSDPGSPVDGNLWYNSTSKSFKAREAGLTLADQHVAYNATANGTTVVNTTSLTASYTSVSFPANFWTVGKAIEVSYAGNYSTKAATTPALKVSVGWANSGTVFLDGGPTWTTAAGAAGAQFRGDIRITCRSTGASGSFLVEGVEFFNSSVVNFGPVFAAPTVDTTQAGTVNLYLQWGTADPANTAAGGAFVVKVLDPP